MRCGFVIRIVRRASFRMVEVVGIADYKSANSFTLDYKSSVTRINADF